MAHTPGPWTLEDVMSSPLLHDICVGYQIPGAGNPVLLATVFFDEEGRAGITLEEANANARLIKAAPNLLAACEEALDLIDRRNNILFIKVAAMLKAAIAEATKPPV